jgi:hypothetical protein
MFASVESFQRHPRVVIDRAVDVNEVNVLVSEDFVVRRVSLIDPELVAALFEFRRITTTDRRNVGIRMSLIDRNELGSKAKSNHRHIELFRHDSHLC